MGGRGACCLLFLLSLYQEMTQVASRDSDYNSSKDSSADSPETGVYIAKGSLNDKIGTNINGMKRLLSEVLQFYDTRIRPRTDQAQTVQVNSSFVPTGLIEFDTSEQKFSILGYLRIRWQDEVVTWDLRRYGDTNFIKVPVSEIWKPGLIILKAFHGDGVVGNDKTDIAKISSEGIVQWVPNGIYSIVCHVDIKYYPFDEQTCTFTYYVSDETVTTVELDHPEDVTLDEYTENSAWKITGITKSRYLKYNSYYVDVQFKLQRRSNFATFTLIMPLLMLAFLNTCMFLVPIGSGEKGSFAITIFLSYGIFVTIVSDTLPDNSLQISYFLLFIIVLLFMSVLSVLYTIVQSKLMASIGDKECTVKCFRTRKLSNNKVMPSEEGSTESGCDSDKNTEVSSVEVGTSTPKELYTWGVFLEKMDTVIFLAFFVVILLSTAGFFSLILRGVSESKLSQI